MRYTSQAYDWRMGIDKRAVEALKALGIIAGEIHGLNGRLKGAVFTFHLASGNREWAKHCIEDFLSDEYGATDVLFFANPHKQGECYASFDMNMRSADRGTKNR